MKSKQDLYTSESEGQANFLGSQRSTWGTAKRSRKAAEAAELLHGGGACGILGVRTCVPALLLLRARMQSSYILRSQTHVHLAELEAGIFHGANSCPVRENIINLTTNPTNSSWFSQEFFTGNCLQPVSCSTGTPPSPSPPAAVYT